MTKGFGWCKDSPVYPPETQGKREEREGTAEAEGERKARKRIDPSSHLPTASTQPPAPAGEKKNRSKNKE